MRTRALAGSTAAAAVALAFASSANAATVELKTRTEGGIKGPDYTVTTVMVQAAAGELNAITATVVAATAKLVLTDPSAALTAAAGCTQTAAATVQCALPDVISATLDDGNDSFSIDPAYRSLSGVRGGAGDDVLTGGAGADTLSGGGGRDVLIGGLGSDTLADEDGSTPDADLLDGGVGEDSISFEDHLADMTLDLAARTTSEGDTLSGFETVRLGKGANTVTGTAGREYITAPSNSNRIDGGAGNDAIYAGGELSGGDGNDTLGCTAAVGCRLAGGPGNDMLQTGAGDDVIDGGAGNDELYGLGGDDLLDGGPGDDTLRGDFAEGVPGSGDDTLRGGSGADDLYGGPGKDRLDAGAGADLVLSLDYARDTIGCGAGIDRLVRDKLDPVKPASCERVQLGGTLELLPEIDLDRYGADIELAIDTSCPGYVVGRCRGVMEVRDLAGRFLGRRPYRVTGQRTVYVELNAAGRAALRSGIHTIVVRVRGGDGTGGSSTVARTYRIKVR